MKLICRARLSAFLWSAQCCDVSIHCEMISGEQPLPRKNNNSLKVSVSPMGFFQKSSLISCDQTDMGQKISPFNNRKRSLLSWVMSDIAML